MLLWRLDCDDSVVQCPFVLCDVVDVCFAVYSMVLVREYHYGCVGGVCAVVTQLHYWCLNAILLCVMLYVCIVMHSVVLVRIGVGFMMWLVSRYLIY